MCHEQHKAGSWAQILRETQASPSLFWSQWPEVILKTSSMSQGHSRVFSAPSFHSVCLPVIQGRNSCQACPPRSAQLHWSLGQRRFEEPPGRNSSKLGSTRVRKEAEAVLSACLGTQYETLGERNWVCLDLLGKPWVVPRCHGHYSWGHASELRQRAKYFKR